jgi:uncharacterized membrane protein YphA (DoxX/SURF4 family)
MEIVTALARLVVGGVFLAAGVLKVGHAALFASELAAMRIVPSHLIAPIALVLPFFEIALGAYVLAGLYVRVAALVALVQLAILAGVVASVVLRHLPVSCGCFGPGDTSSASWADVARDVALALIALVVARRQPDRFTLDAVWASSPASGGKLSP